jgi:hypothetical protein
MVVIKWTFYIRTCVYIMPLSGPQNEHHNYLMRFIMLYKISCIFIDFWKCFVSKHGSSKQIRRRCGKLSHCLAGRSACSFFKFSKFLVVASIFVLGVITPSCLPWLCAWTMTSYWGDALPLASCFHCICGEPCACSRQPIWNVICLLSLIW